MIQWKALTQRSPAKSPGFQLTGLTRLAYGNGFALWHYRSHTDRLEAMTSQQYFAGTSLAAGDVIILVAADGAKQMFVSATSDYSVSLCLM